MGNIACSCSRGFWGEVEEAIFGNEDSKTPEAQFLGGGRVRKQVAFDNGAVYTGEWLGDARDGYGVQVWDDGARYEGQWVNDKAQGKGKFVHVDGDVYFGDWVEDRAHGHGVYHHADGSR
ncbi:hypothetical protein, conserved [Eimeria necatrix]|uniref:MORN repeat-containing protein n=1 Tax=Eimeria necatrix TaxID=51315 RepID=U6MQL3_9EIME|nr:hypothetical protein, conserved [Eimeria necatrix]CDJ66301.1 hypothetical protein, conserved [Eimeria necatrix]